MILKNRILSLILIFFVLLSGCTNKSQSDSSKNSGKNESVLRVALSPDMPGFFSFNGQKLGYAYDLLDAYAQSKGLTLEIIPAGGAQSLSGELNDKAVDMAITLHPRPIKGSRASILLYETSYVILTTTSKAQAISKDNDITDWLKGENILVSTAFMQTQNYQEMAAGYPSIHFTSSARNTFELLESLINGRYDFLICEKSEALLGCALIRNIEKIYQFEQTVSVSAVLNDGDPREGRQFAAWVHDFRMSHAGQELQAMYCDKGIYHRIITGGIRNRKANSISIYDDLFKKIAQETHIDWRLISAIAYSESKYNAYLVSPRGARGLMQVMPATAKAFKVSVDDLMDPETNVRVAVKLIREIEKSLRFGPDALPDDRTNMMLACYNGGIGHVMDARRLASKHGANPDSWSDVAHYLELKAEPEYAQDDVVNCGTFNGAGQTISFVRHVTGKYLAYSGRK